MIATVGKENAKCLNWANKGGLDPCESLGFFKLGSVTKMRSRVQMLERRTVDLFLKEIPHSSRCLSELVAGFSPGIIFLTASRIPA